MRGIRKEVDMTLTIGEILRAVTPNIGVVQNSDGSYRISIEDINSDEILTAVEAMNTAFGAMDDAIVAAGAVGTLSAKLRRVTQGLADLLSNGPLSIARGNIAGIIHINKFGRNPDCAQAASATAVNLGRSIWDGGIAGAVNWVAPTASRIHQLKSSSVNDDTDGGGTNAGARTVQIYGLDSDYNLFNETLTLDGTTNVATASYTMIYRMIVRSSGTTGWNEGFITVTADSDGTVTARITEKNNQTLMTQYMIPANTKGYMTNYSATLKKSGGVAKLADIFLMSMEFGEVWRIRDATSVATDGANSVPREFKPHKVFLAKELIQVIANPSADAQDISAGYDLILVDN